MRVTIVRLAGLLGLLALLLLPVTALASPALTVSPGAGPAGTTFQISGTGFEANSAPILFAEDAGGNNAVYTQPKIGPDGSFRVSVDSTGFRPGQYMVIVTSIKDFSELARGTMTVAATPGMPNTGAGGAARQGVPAGFPAAVLVLTGLALGVVSRRRRA